jgi:hypothetical protein
MISAAVHEKKTFKEPAKDSTANPLFSGRPDGAVARLLQCITASEKTRRALR